MKKQQEIKEKLLMLKREMREVQEKGDLTRSKQWIYRAKIQTLNWVLERGIYE